MSSRTLRFRPDGTFHILLVSDLHGGDKYFHPQKHALHVLLEEAKPDLVLFGGDMVVADMFSAGHCEETPLREFLTYTLAELEENNIPWAHVWGNHDGESKIALTPDKQRESLIMQDKVYRSFTTCVSGESDPTLHGFSNYFLPVLASGSDDVAWNLIAMDSLSSISDLATTCGMPDCTFRLPNNLFPSQNHDATPLFDQIRWYWETSEAAEKAAGHKIPAVMWTHVPPMEMRLIADNPAECHFEGNRNENIGCPIINTGLFAACLQRGDVKGIFFGHDHVNDFSGELFGIRMGFDGALYDMRRHRAIPDNRGGREIILHENSDKLDTRQINLERFHLPVEEP